MNVVASGPLFQMITELSVNRCRSENRYPVPTGSSAGLSGVEHGRLLFGRGGLRFDLLLLLRKKGGSTIYAALGPITIVGFPSARRALRADYHKGRVSPGWPGGDELQLVGVGAHSLRSVSEGDQPAKGYISQIEKMKTGNDPEPSAPFRGASTL
jgi:hypothetical protein